MRDDRLGGIALIAGTAGLLVTMGFHPAGHELFAPGQLESKSALATAVHALAIACLPVLFLGALALARRLAGPDRLAIAALVAYGLASVAGLAAATVSGFVSVEMARGMMTGAAEHRDAFGVALHLSGALNQGFAKVLGVASSAAIALFSGAILASRALPRALGVCGLLVGIAIVAALVLGFLRLDVHGFGLVVLVQGAWFVAAGVLLRRPR